MTDTEGTSMAQDETRETVLRLAQIMEGGDPDPCLGSLSDAEAILDALPALLREDSPAGEALRERLGLKWGYIGGPEEAPPHQHPARSLLTLPQANPLRTTP